MKSDCVEKDTAVRTSDPRANQVGTVHSDSAQVRQIPSRSLHSDHVATLCKFHTVSRMSGHRRPQLHLRHQSVILRL
jgi:hypothetical protein